MLMKNIKNIMSLLGQNLYHPYKTWDDLTPEEFEARQKNAFKNMCTNLQFLFGTKDWKGLEKKLLSEGLQIVISGGETDHFNSGNAFLKSYYSLNIQGNIILENCTNWDSEIPLDSKFFAFPPKDQSLEFNNETAILFNYTVPPCANDIKEHQLPEYYEHMRYALKLGMYSMCNFYKDNKKIVMVWNPFGLGAFLRRFKPEHKQAEIKREVIKIMFEVYNAGNYFNSAFIFVGRNLISDDEFESIYDSVFDELDLIKKQKRVVITSGDMLDIALAYREMDYNVAISMAADCLGPGNQFYKLPEAIVKGNARKASDENNTRRTNIIWKVLYLNLKAEFEKSGRKKVFNFTKASKKQTEFDKLKSFGQDISKAYSKRDCDLYAVINKLQQ